MNTSHACHSLMLLATARWKLSGGDKPEQSGWFAQAWVQAPAGWWVVHDHSS